MHQPPRAFEEAEFAARCAAAQAAMQQAGVAATLLTSEAEIRYFTGFMTQFWQSPTRPWFVLIPASGKPVAIIPSIGVPLMRDCYIGDLQSWPSPAADDDGITLLLSVIRDILGTSGRLGMMMAGVVRPRRRTLAAATAAESSASASSAAPIVAS